MPDRRSAQEVIEKNKKYKMYNPVKIVVLVFLVFNDVQPQAPNA